MYLLFPGRHHLLTRFQAAFLTGFAAELGAESGRDVTVVFAVTSANHHTTRRNPVPFHRREAAIERFAVATGLRCLVVGVTDTPPTDDFADVTVKEVEAGTDDLVRPEPGTTVVACSTPEVAKLYERLGYRVVGVEPEDTPRPWDVLMMLAAGDDRWRELAHPATADVFDRYGLEAHVRRCVNDPVVGDDGGLTPTRDYKTYADAFETAADRKWADLKDFVQPGRILDIGCATGATLQRVDADPRFHESDLIGVEVARHLYAECVHQKEQGRFHNPNVHFYQRNVLGGTVFPARSIDTTLTLALTHEIWSYADGSRPATVRRFADRLFAHTAPGGVWINSDVCGPAEPDRPVLLTLDDSDGANPPEPIELEALADPAAYVGGLSTRGRFVQFAHDFRRNAGVPFAYTLHGGTPLLRLADAMDFLTRKDYVDNWLSESHEQFCGLTYADWTGLVRAAGFTVDPASRPWRNDWIVEHRLAPVAALHTPDGAGVDWPDTHLLLVARRPA